MTNIKNPIIPAIFAINVIIKTNAIKKNISFATGKIILRETNFITLNNPLTNSGITIKADI
jgi:hypothetical protein